MFRSDAVEYHPAFGTLLRKSFRNNFDSRIQIGRPMLQPIPAAKLHFKNLRSRPAAFFESKHYRFLAIAM